MPILSTIHRGHNACAGRVETAHAITQTAATVARLHELTAGLVVLHPRVRSGTDSRRLLREFLEYAAQRDVSTPEPATTCCCGPSGRNRPHGADRAMHARPSDLPRGIVHHDAHCANVLFRDGRLVARIDFDDACEGSWSRTSPRWSPTGRRRRRGALDPGAGGARGARVRTARPLTAVERDLLPDFVAAFMLADGAAYIRDRLAQGAHGDTAVHESHAYPAFSSPRPAIRPAG